MLLHRRKAINPQQQSEQNFGLLIFWYPSEFQTKFRGLCSVEEMFGIDIYILGFYNDIVHGMSYSRHCKRTDLESVLFLLATKKSEDFS